MTVFVSSGPVVRIYATALKIRIFAEASRAMVIFGYSATSLDQIFRFLTLFCQVYRLPFGTVVDLANKSFVLVVCGVETAQHLPPLQHSTARIASGNKLPMLDLLAWYKDRF